MKRLLDPQLIKDLDLSRDLLEDCYAVTSDKDGTYNCLAWAACDGLHWWDPTDEDSYWPKEVERSLAPSAVAKAFETRGYQECLDGSFDQDYQKIALYGTSNEIVHASRQLIDGSWATKLGPDEDVIHASPEDFEGRAGGDNYGRIVKFMQRRRKEDDPAPPEKSRWPVF